MSRAQLPHGWLILIGLMALAPLFYLEEQPYVDAAERLPIFSPPEGFYQQDVFVTLDSSYPEAEVIFTQDGSIPSGANGTLFTRPLHLAALSPTVVVIRARVVLPAGEMGPVITASYLIGVDSTIPVISLTADPDDLWNPEDGILTNPQRSGRAWERPADVFYWDQQERSGFHVSAGIRVHGDSTRLDDKKSFRIYFRQEYGCPWLQFPLFEDQEGNIKRLILHSGGQEYPSAKANATLLRTSLMMNLSSQIGGFSSHVRPAVLFINGELWGIYNLRERIDEFFLDQQYGIESADIIDLSVKAGDGDHWQNMIRFVETHDLSEASDFAYVEGQIDIANFIDYYVLQIYAANKDWPHHNDKRFRPRTGGGRWHWIFWDVDYSFGLGPISHIELDMMPWLLDSNQADLQATLLVRKLMENPDFRTRFLSRTADLLNTTLNSTNVISQINVLADELEPNIAFETQRWSSAGNWIDNVQYLRDFAEQRPDYVRQHMIDWFQMADVAQLTITPPTDGSGEVAINNFHLAELPWQGNYFEGSTITLAAIPHPGYQFEVWEPLNTPRPTISLTITGSQSITPHFVEAGDVPSVGDVIIAGYGTDGDGWQVPAAIRGDWIRLVVKRTGGIDLRGWRITDNDSKTATDEGSLIFDDNSALAAVPQGTSILIVASKNEKNDDLIPRDDLDGLDRRILIYVGNGNLDTVTDPWFELGQDDNLVLLAPGSSSSFDDDQGIDLFLIGDSPVAPASFGIWLDEDG